MKGVRFLGGRRAVVEVFRDPEPGHGEVVVELRAAGLCGSDLQQYRTAAGSGEVPTVIVGHEGCGVVVSAGAGVDRRIVDSRVVVNHHYGCGVCPHCDAGTPKYCSGVHGTYGFTDDGADADADADAEYMVARASTLAPMPEALGFEEGALVACGAGTRLQHCAGCS